MPNLCVAVLRRGCDRGDDGGPRDAHQPRPGGAEEEAAGPERREPPHSPEDDEVRPQPVLRLNHTGRRRGQGKDDARGIIFCRVSSLASCL